MDGMVDGCLRECERDGTLDVLELGWGLGLSGRRFLANDVRYTVVEANAAVAETARAALRDHGDGHRVIESLWQSVDLEPESFDVVFFDAYYTTHEPSLDYRRDVFRFCTPLVRPGGVFTFFLDNRYEHVELVQEYGYRRIVAERITGFEMPADCTYWRPDVTYWLSLLAIK